MLYFVIIITYVFDLFIIISFMNGVLERRKEHIPYPVFLSCFFLVEVILYVNEYFTDELPADISLIVTTFVSLLTTFGLTFLFQTNIRHRIFTAVSFQIFALLGESFFTLTIQKINPHIFNMNETYVSILMNLGSKIVLYLFVLICNLFWNKHIRKFGTIQYNALLFSTPVISLIIMLIAPLKNIINYDNYYFFLILYISLTVLNIINYLLLEKVFRIAELNQKNHAMEQQIQYQKDKYIQLGTAYKSNRSVLHDMKKHYFTISEYVRQKKFDQLQDYLKTSMEKLESGYICINTGNLVIDSFVSNYKTVAENNSIYFDEDISIDTERIPINDYELCVILGNHLDNSLNACNHISGSEKRIQLEIYNNENDTFMIHIKNTYSDIQSENMQSFDNVFNHGYGLDNIKKIVEENYGIFKLRKGEYFEIFIIIPIIDIKKRLHPPVTKLS